MSDVVETKQLTRRQAQCLTLVAAGRSQAQVGHDVGISPRTVRFHLDTARRKLSCRTLCALVAKAIRTKEIES